MKKQRVRKIKVRYINTAERKAEAQIDAFLARINHSSFNLHKELAELMA